MRASMEHHDFTYTLKDCVIFSKLDLRQSYHQLAIDKESSKVATFSTPWDNYRPKQLVFGAKFSQDLFDKVMYRVFGGIEQCKNQRDDIILGGKSIEGHNRILQEVMSEIEMKINIRDAEYKRKMKEKKGNRNFRETQLILGDYVLVKQPKRNKLWSTAYEPTFYNVTRIDGSKITARRVTDGRIISRDASHFKLANSVIDSRDDTGYMTMKSDDTNKGRMNTEEICEDRQVLERGKEDIKIRAGGASEKEIPIADEPEIMEEHEEELPSPETMEKEETSSQRPERKPETAQERTPRPRRATRRPKHYDDFVTDF